MIEYMQDNITGEVRPNQLVETQMYQFWFDYHSNRITEEEKARGVVAKLTADISGVILKDDKRVVRFEFIYFVLPDGKPRKTYEDFLDVDIILPEDAVKQIDESQIIKVKWEVKSHYKWVIMRDPEFLSKIPIKNDNMIRIIRKYNKMYNKNLSIKTRRISQ